MRKFKVMRKRINSGINLCSNNCCTALKASGKSFGKILVGMLLGLCFLTIGTAVMAEEISYNADSLAMTSLNSSISGLMNDKKTNIFSYTEKLPQNSSKTIQKGVDAKNQPQSIRKSMNTGSHPTGFASELLAYASINEAVSSSDAEKT